MAFDDLDKLFAHIANEVALSMDDQSQFAQKIKEKESEFVDSTVFSAYEPFEYTRRTNDGLEDISNMVAESIVVGDQVVFSLTNETTGYNDSNFYIAPLVEYGDAEFNTDIGQGEYTWKFNRDGTEYKFLQPRPFTESTIEYLESSGYHIEVLRESLRGNFELG